MRDCSNYSNNLRSRSNETIKKCRAPRTWGLNVKQIRPHASMGRLKQMVAKAKDDSTALIESGLSSAVLLCSCDLDSKDRTWSFEEFFVCLLSATYCLWKLSSVSFSTSRSCPGSSCSSVKFCVTGVEDERVVLQEIVVSYVISGLKTCSPHGVGL